MNLSCKKYYTKLLGSKGSLLVHKELAFSNPPQHRSLKAVKLKQAFGENNQLSSSTCIREKSSHLRQAKILFLFYLYLYLYYISTGRLPDKI